MKKKLALSLAFAFTMGVAGTAFADSNPFVDVPKNHWSYDAVSKLAADKIIDGYGDKTFRGDKAITRYEMAQVVAKAVGRADKASAADKALIQKLYTEYKEELKSMNVRVSSLEGDVKELKSKIDNVTYFGFVRAKYDSDQRHDIQTADGNRHFYMDFEANMKVNDQWTGHFQSETHKEYTAYTFGHSANADGSDGTIQRIWATGNIGNVGVSFGKKWWSFDNQNVLFGKAAEGIRFDVPIGNCTISAFNMKTADQGEVQLANATKTSFYGGVLNGNITKDINLNFAAVGNTKDEGAQMSNAWSLGTTAKLSPDFTLNATYVKTNADKFNNSQEYRLDYKGADLNTPGSYGIYTRYFKFQANGDYAHDTEWGSLTSDTKGIIFGVDYILAKNIQWTTLYSDQKMNISGTQVKTVKDLQRKLFRTQVDLHF